MAGTTRTDSANLGDTELAGVKVCNRFGGRLAKKLPHRIQAQRTKSARTWAIRPGHWIMPDEPPPVEAEALG